MNWDPNLCRICGQINETCHLICENNLDIQHKLKQCLNISVHKEDYKPKQICNDCLIKLNEFYNFMEACHTTNVRFEALLMNKAEWHSSSSTRNYGPQKKISGIVTSRPNNDSLDCADIDLYKDSMLSLENIESPNCAVNIVENTNSYSPIEANINAFISPPVFDKQYSDSCYNQDGIAHQVSGYPMPTNTCNSVQSSSSNSVQNSSANASINPIHGTPINYHFSQPKSLLQDEREVVSNLLSYSSISCTESPGNVIPECALNQNEKETVTNQQEAVQEVQEVVEETKAVHKPSNKKSMISVDAITTYMKIVPPHCKPKTQKKDKVKDKNRPLFKCDLCEKKFMRKLTLNAHMAVHTKLRPFVCDVCDKSFAVKCDLTNHQRLHSEDYKCQQCSKTFPVPSKLERHIRTHTKQRPFSCDYKNCGRAFSDKRNLESHKYTHIEERNFKCEVCGKHYKSKNSLKEHGKAHNSKLQYKCVACGKEYKWKSTLALHKKKHTGYFCPYCNKDCGKAWKFNKHRKECKARAGSE